MVLGQRIMSRPMRDPTRTETEPTMDESTEGHHAPDILSNRKAGGLLLAFLGTVILILAVVALLPAPMASTTTHEPISHTSGSDVR